MSRVHGSSGRAWGRALLYGLVPLAFGAGFHRTSERPLPSRFRISEATSPSAGKPESDSRFVSLRHDVNAHVASLVELGDGRLRAFWFSGSHEGARDVLILSATFDPRRATWSEARAVIGPEATERALLRRVVKVGNPTAIRTADGTLWLFYVTVTLGGWGGSTVSVVRSVDEGDSWSPARRLIGSPFFNLNTMVRGAPFAYDDATLGLPAYQSLLRGFAEVLRLDASGAVIDKQRLSRAGEGSQPAILPTTPGRALALMRASGQPRPGRVMLSRTDDAGRHWTRPRRTTLRNPDSGVGGIALPGGRILAALNDVAADERDALSLAVSDDAGASWRTIHRLEDQEAARRRPVDDRCWARTVEALARATGASPEDARRCVTSSRRFMCWEPRCHFEFSYPFLLRTTRGEIHLLYTWNRAYIKHVRFNQAWLDQRLASPLAPRD